MTPEQTAGLAQARARAMVNIEPDDPAYIADDQAYLADIMAKWAAAQTPAPSQADIDACRERALDNWAGLDAPLPPEAPPLSPEGQKAALIAYATNKRWLVETGGVTINGITVPTNADGQRKILGAAGYLADGATSPLIIDGVVYGEMSKAQFGVVNAAIVEHIRKSYVTLAGALGTINDGSITTTAQIDALSWST